MKTITILGSTGSVGTQTVDVAQKRGVRVLGISFNSNTALAEKQARALGVKFVATPDIKAAKELRERLCDTDISVLSGTDAVCELASMKCDKVFNSITGCAGLPATLAAIRSGNMLALANKESLVSAGKLVMNEAKKHGVTLLPVDSEHTAIHECLRSGKHAEVKKLILTASGGPFFGMSCDDLEKVTPEMALKHPNWSMGSKITIDSSTLMNKAFEIVEAAYLYNIAYDKIEVLVHRESIIHSMVEYIDNSLIAELSVPDMHHSAEYALDYPDRCEATIKELDLTKLSGLTFANPDTKAFPMLNFGREILMCGQGFGAAVNSANETAVKRFLNKEIGYNDIYRCVRYTTEKLGNGIKSAETVEDIFAIENEARAYASKFKSQSTKVII